MTDKWFEWLVDGGDMPSITLPKVDMPDNITLFKCSNCGQWNDYWTELCSECDLKEAKEVDDAIQG